MSDAASIDPAAREKLLAAVDAAQRILDEAKVLLGATADRAHDAPATSPEVWQPDWGKLGDVEKLLHCSRLTALRKIKLHGLGHVVDRRWSVDLNRVRALQAKAPFPPLPSAE